MQARAFSLRELAVLFTLCAVALTTAGVLGAWTGPTATPPNNNAYAPINVGSTGNPTALQTKNDQLSVYGLAADALAVFGNTILSGSSPRYINFDTTAGSAGYGIRDNGGVIEYKDNGGSWTPLTASTNSCTFNGQTVTHGASVTAYQSSSAAYGSQCVSEQRTCTDGTLSGTYQYSSCTVSSNLYGNVHTTTECTSLGGTVRTISGSYLCERSGTSCFSGWTRYSNWGSTQSQTCSGSGQQWCGGSSCNTGAHAWANTATESCTYSNNQLVNNGQDLVCNPTYYTCTAILLTVGCY